MNDPQTSSNRDEALSIAHPLRRLEADFLRPYRGKITLGLLGLLVQAVLLLPVPLLQLLSRHGHYATTYTQQTRGLVLAAGT